MADFKVALVYDRVNKWGGAERVLLALNKIFPKAPLYTAVYNPQTASWAQKFKVIPSFLQKFPFAKVQHEFYPWLTPLAFESFDFSQFDLVVSLTSAEAKGIITRPETFHLCYCLTPTRYLWSGRNDYFKSPGFGDLDFLARSAMSFVFPYLSKWDKIAGQRPDYFLAISKNVQRRIKKYYGRDSELIYPPVNLEKFKFSAVKPCLPAKNFFLIVSRLIPYKRIDIAIEAFNRLGLPLKIIGIGSDLTRLKKLARTNIEFLGQLTDNLLLRYYYSCRAVICPQEEDLGLVPLEAQACGKPVVSFRGGGALETVIKSKTGEFFYPQTAEALFRLIKRFKPEKFKPQACQKNAEKFSQKVFIKKFENKIRSLEQWFRNKN
jgi:glycosyltransferase involved in cell wall biosynthesis